MATVGNATDFGDLSATKGSCGTTSSSTRGLIMGGRTPSNLNVIEYITIGSTGNVTDFGDLTDVTSTNAGASSATRGLSAGGLNPGDSAGVNTIGYVTIASTGNAQDFGDLTTAIRENNSGATSNNHSGISDENMIQSPSVSYMPGSGRGLFAGLHAPSHSNAIDLVTIPTLGNSSDFGNLTVARGRGGAASSLTRLIVFGGETPSSGVSDVIDSTEFAPQGS